MSAGLFELSDHDDDDDPTTHAPPLVTHEGLSTGKLLMGELSLSPEAHLNDREKRRREGQRNKGVRTSEVGNFQGSSADRKKKQTRDSSIVHDTSVLLPPSPRRAAPAVASFINS